ncbi:MAG: GIY-YIG nuclease family protein [Paracoccaceae bacterium]|nr:GIY-YIG nuclease family protein [Paracoccaceae bacterium]MDG2259700.1 GIY-YIG nuclease family protein [Paracoccaceae bacterium]
MCSKFVQLRGICLYFRQKKTSPARHGERINLEQRLKQLDNTSVPLPFRCVYAVKVADMDSAERLAHGAFADHRTRSNREFFELDPQRVISALKLTGGDEVTPKDDIAADDEGLRALEKRKRRTYYTLYQAGLKDGDVLHYSKDETVVATVIGPKRVAFEGNEHSLTSSALIALHRDGYNWKTVNGWSFWMMDEEAIADRLQRLLTEQDED